MANAENLIPNSKRSPSELRAMASKGGKARARKIKERKMLKDLLETALETKTQTGNYAIDITQSLINQALLGNVKAYETIRDTVVQKPIESVKIENPQATQILESINRQLKKK